MTDLAVATALAGLVVATTLLGLLWKSRQGRVSPAAGTRQLDLPGVALDGRTTFVQFSSPVCSACRSTARLLDELSTGHPGVGHVELDVTDHPELASRLNIMQTPTTLLVGGDGILRARFNGAAPAVTVREQLDSALSGSAVPSAGAAR
ncbi:thioredoxin family protein [Zhihengliuella salsuginis]|uniref:Thioredoxin domain-containing protein n=1 Tax=Zhihengliuella salsuginis TaxID=578222 RepID=A0ABQ3GB00_9MICC|nr:thioredoxin family protein [Zhihengliuella salsuginis]GHD00243.1 hypothetical protein GCM10008096_03280 [Zhihengliuella salsuginis]